MRLLRVGEVGFQRFLDRADRRGLGENLRIERGVRTILREVRRRGDEALIAYTRRFDGVAMEPRELEVKRQEIERAYGKVPTGLLEALRRASRRIERFHRLSLRKATIARVERGIRLEQRTNPLERVGIYVPGGKASYPSTVLMAAIPARIAGVREIVMTTPPHAGGVNPAVLVSADLAGVDRIYRIGGVQAIAALAYGTASIPKVDKIVGPGNRYVAAAKKLVYGSVDVDMVAGPSEIVVIADGTPSAPASYVAADLLSQAEHDESAWAVLITPSGVFGKRVREEVSRRLLALERREIARKSLERNGAILLVKDLDQAVEVANRIAPEHLELAVSNPRSLVSKVRHAGSVFLGGYTPEAIGDYLAGPNHILPTAGTARFSSPLGVEDFLKRINWVTFEKEALARFERDLCHFTQWEGLEGHYKAVRVRLGRGGRGDEPHGSV